MCVMVRVFIYTALSLLRASPHLPNHNEFHRVGGVVAALRV